ncbi:hypothetical protein CMT52_21145 [Elizabethkingia anophelis]|nr:hypothetical protein [Elizabethkingia anophelis]
MKTLLTYFLTNLIQIHFGATMNEKLFSTFKIVAIPTIGFSLFEKLTGWYIENYIFIILLVGAWIGDLIVGVWKHYKMDSISLKKMLLGFAEKGGIILIAYFIIEAIIQIMSDGDLDSVYFKIFTKILLFSYPAGNIAINMGIITNGKFPPIGFLKKFEKFNSSLDLNVFKNSQNETENNITDSN